MKRYYMGAEHIGDAIGRGADAPITRETIDEATEDARKALRKNPDREVVVVVEIVRIVRRDQLPIVVEDLDRGE